MANMSITHPWHTYRMLHKKYKQTRETYVQLFLTSTFTTQGKHEKFHIENKTQNFHRIQDANDIKVARHGCLNGVQCTHATVNGRASRDRENELCTYKIDSLNVKHFAYYFSRIDMSRRLCRTQRKKKNHTPYTYSSRLLHTRAHTQMQFIILPPEWTEQQEKIKWNSNQTCGIYTKTVVEKAAEPASPRVFFRILTISTMVRNVNVYSYIWLQTRDWHKYRCQMTIFGWDHSPASPTTESGGKKWNVRIENAHGQWPWGCMSICSQKPLSKSFNLQHKCRTSVPLHTYTVWTFPSLF